MLYSVLIFLHCGPVVREKYFVVTRSYIFHYTLLVQITDLSNWSTVSS